MQQEFYHVLNRGVDKRTIFTDSRDYARFIHDLYEFNSTERTDPNVYRNFSIDKMMDIGCPSSESKSDVASAASRQHVLRTGERLVDIHFFCLMPNHYHLLLSPLVEHGISLFMKKVNMGYAKYFNERNERSGSLFQGKYKSIHITNEAHFMYLPFYIHLNPLDLCAPEWRIQKINDIKNTLAYLTSYRWSSHLDYSGRRNFPSITNRKFFEKFFASAGGYDTALNNYLKTFDIQDITSVTLE